MQQKWLWAILAVVVVILVIAVAFAFGLFDTDERERTTTRSQLTGVEVDREAAERPILAAMIENSEAARPQTGLDSAGIVFEVVTEGGITRYLAFFQEDIPEEIGPIRSLRPNFVDWAMGFDASVAHVGGSEEALEMVDERDTKSLDQFQHPEPYYRDDGREAPHNMYANTDALLDLQSELNHTQSQFSEIPRSEDAPADNAEAEDITINYSQPLYEVIFRYQESDNTYQRELAGDPHIDEASGDQISVSNLIVIRTEGDVDVMEATSSGEALVFKNGEVIEAQWQKDSHQGRIEIVGEDGEEVPLNRGATWFAVLPQDRSLQY